MESLVDEIRKRYLEVFRNHLGQADGTPFYTADLVMFGILDRQIGLAEAMPRVFADKNVHALAPLLRIQLDSLLRLHAFWIVESPDDLAKHVIGGGNFRNFKDREGNQLFDRHLVNTLKNELPWVESMYTTLSGWVHFSESHIFSAVSDGDEDRTIKVGIGTFREETPPRLFEEATAAFVDIHRHTADLVEAYFARQRSRAQ